MHDIHYANSWLHRLGLRTLELSMTFFVPVIASSNTDNEFGPEAYASDESEATLPYAVNDLIMGLKLCIRGLTAWAPEEAEYRHLTATWLVFLIPGLSIMTIIQSQMSFRSLYLYIKERQGRKGAL